MVFSVSLIDNNFSLYEKELKSYFQEDVKFNFFNNYDELKNSKLEEINLYIISEQELNKELLTLIDSNNINKIILSKDANNEKLLDKYFDYKIFDFITLPINLKKLYYKILHYKNIQENLLNIEKERNFTNLIVNSSHSLICVFHENDLIYSNKKFLEMFDCSNMEEFNQDIELITKKFFNANTKNIISYLQSDDCKKIEIIKENKVLTFSLDKNICEHNNNIVISLNNITKEIEHENQLINMLYTDNLTKLPNRAKLILDLQKNTYKIHAIAIIDLNSFKEINDFYGNKIGDAILLGIAELINDSLKGYENLHYYKFHADTYAIVHSVDDNEFFNNLIVGIIEKIDKKVFTFDQNEIDTRATAGISFSSQNNKLITADLALQAAKRDHKDYLVFYDELDNLKEYQNNMLWTKKLKKALQNDDIIVYYQPLVNNKTLMVEKYECLVRMIDGEKIVSPFFFLDVSKKSNQYTKITKTVIQKSFKEFENLPFEFSVNVSYEDIEDETFLDFIKENLEKYNVSKKVVFEILEDEGIKRYDVLINFIEEVKKLGCKIAIDDFGSGYSNFEHLLKMNVDFLKIDASLIKNIATDDNSYKITKTIIEFAKSLNLKTIAEYVENKEIFELVKSLGADYSQGYYFSAPLSRPNIYTAVNKVMSHE